MCRLRTIFATTTDDLGQVLTYDAWNRLISVSSSTGIVLQTYQYDGIDRRIEEATPGSNPTELYYSSSWQVLEEDSGATGAMLHAQNIWSPVYVNALVLRDYDFAGTGSFQLNERVYLTQDAEWNTTGVIVRISGTPGDELPDSNGDGIVGFTELILVAQHYGQTIAGGDAVGDFNHDGVVGFADSLLVSQNYGATTSIFTWVMAMHFGYTPYGVDTGYTADFSSTAANFMLVSNLFEGGREDFATGLIHFDDRDYDPRTYTWVTTDPLQLAPTFYDAFADNPINRLDPWGLQATTTQAATQPTLAKSGTGTWGAGDSAFDYEWDMKELSSYDKAIRTSMGTNDAPGVSIVIAVTKKPKCPYDKLYWIQYTEARQDGKVYTPPPPASQNPWAGIDRYPQMTTRPAPSFFTPDEQNNVNAGKAFDGRLTGYAKGDVIFVDWASPGGNVPNWTQYSVVSLIGEIKGKIFIIGSLQWEYSTDGSGKLGGYGAPAGPNDMATWNKSLSGGYPTVKIEQ